MSRYIDANMYIEYLTELKQSAEKHHKIHEALQLQHRIDQIKCFPTADVQEVVCCKDCSFYEETDYFPDGKKSVCKLFNRQMQEDDFCSYGAKMDEE